MKVIALKGAPNTGKSETINIVYQLMLNIGYVQVPGHFVGPLGNPSMRDFRDVLQKEDKRVGIVSIGDYAIGPLSVKNQLAALLSAGCHVAVCACTTKPGTVSAVNAYPNVWYAKTPAPSPSLERILNGGDANALFLLI